LGLPTALFSSGFTTEILYAFIFLSIPTTCTLTSSSFICSSSKRPHYIILPMYVFCTILGIIGIASLSSNRTTVLAMR
jgi:ABC-type transport system involved in multi-copper enzyme maturation permease subunit